MMEYWNVVIEFDHCYADDGVDEDILDAFLDWHAAVAQSPSGRLEVTLSLPAESMRQACLTALSLLADRKSLPEAIQIRVLQSAEFDRLNGFAPVPPMLSVTEAAAVLNISRQRVLQMIHDHSLHGVKVGNGWALVRAEIDSLLAAKHNESIS
ncbi:helix-turn-helix domain-containing protein [Bifidobacterium scardovii]|uniref:Putative DNA binding protein n=1 Tax=Bifidobacterium scardovii TaxID=158787 RepID=A0A087DI49_9BIFI|nr:helix-turn-helix domain-containing protein [Bifidobacterium scardovii]KFI95199.1 putative DNA binding protein [Bifidobacterium scardovii]MDK6348721.1 helix-turn-helix domain-containing protein [Bifidobacterium scardovii]MDU8981302.1 helix-turn-helix domain-containing protein [Bifidobacterium scardovii]BAQ31584.1 hypothetical protein BBSC_1504 [Bifidobacterium scardovii JCM 12489 = DSM 13734]